MIVIPMAGRSKRFSDAGYTVPKFQLKLSGQSLFHWSIASFAHYFENEEFLFILNPEHESLRFVESECRQLGIRRFQVVELTQTTRGQAETVAQGIRQATHNPNDSLIIFNIDTIRPHYRFPACMEAADGYLETFPGEGDGWSFVQPSAGFNCRVKCTTEKIRVSPYCSTGLYYFARTGDFLDVFDDTVNCDLTTFLQQWKELYIAPMYNKLIQRRANILYHHIGKEEVIFSGIPAEYESAMQIDMTKRFSFQQPCS